MLLRIDLIDVYDIMIPESKNCTTDRFLKSVVLNGGAMLEKKPVSQRVMLTKSVIQKALLEMLKTNNINKIAIRKLCKVAGVNHTTFYKYYGSQYEVLDEIIETYIQQTSYAIINNLAAGKSLEESLTYVLHYIKAHLEFMKVILDQAHYDLLNYMKATLPKFDEMVMRNLPESLTLDEKQAIASYVQYGTVGLLKNWILSDCLKSPEEEVKLILNIIAKTLD